MNHREQIEQLQKNRHLIAGGVYTAATVEQVAGWIQTTCELAMRVIPQTSANIDIAQVGGFNTSIASAICISTGSRRGVAAAPLPADMPRVEIIEDDGETT